MVLMMNEMCMRPKYIHLKFWDRSCLNKTLFIIYKAFQTLYTAFYYYFMPFIASLVIFAFLISQNETVATNAYNLNRASASSL